MCTANLCRSPAAAALLARGLPPGSGVEVTSAGTSAVREQAVPAPLTQALAERGVDLAGHRPRQLTLEQVRGADLVLVATRAHRATVVGAVPGALRVTFTLREMARLLAASTGTARGVGPAAPATPGGEVARWASLAPTAAQRRGAPAGADDDLADPYGRSARAYRACVRDVERAAATILGSAGVHGLSAPGL